MRVCVLLMLVAVCACASGTSEEPDSSSQAPAAGAQTQGAKRFELIAPNGEIDRPPSEMRWRVGPGLKSCRAVIITEQAQPIWTSPPSDEGIVIVTEEVQARLEPGELYLWKVVCSFSGLQLGSEYSKFTLARP